MFEKFFNKRKKISVPDVTRLSHSLERQSPRLKSAATSTYRSFLNIYLAHLFSADSCQEKIQQTFYRLALEIGHILIHQDVDPATIELHSSYIVENMRARAQRHSSEMIEHAQTVLIDQRNYLLSEHVNRLGLAAPITEGESPYYCNYEPANAFSCKLMADCSLQRGIAAHMEEATIEKLAENIRQHAYKDMLPLLAAISTSPPIINEGIKEQCHALQLDLQIITFPLLKNSSATQTSKTMLKEPAKDKE